jgi:oligopeptide transport system ATP-binding protein
MRLVGIIFLDAYYVKIKVKIMGKLIEIRKLERLIPLRSQPFMKQEKQYVHAVDGVDLDIYENETLALVGESGCGKSTLGKLLVDLVRPSGGMVKFLDVDIYSLNPKQLREERKNIQMVFQDIGASLNPRKTVEQILMQPLHNYNPSLDKLELQKRIREVLTTVGLNPPESYLHRYPHEFSGGQRQRIGIARAIVLTPKFIVADEPVSALDVSVRGQILNLLNELKGRFKLTYLFITHDMSVVRSIADRVAVMYLGKIVEIAPVENFFAKTLHPYSQAILSATPIADPQQALAREIIELKGELPSPVHIPTGCRFHTRCPSARHICSEKVPDLINRGNEHFVACHLVENN